MLFADQTDRNREVIGIIKVISMSIFYSRKKSINCIERPLEIGIS
tara:strand:- start:9053 stop:9187 length:135 start_codon:yes stop_codon:yes gene_type:complete